MQYVSYDQSLKVRQHHAHREPGEPAMTAIEGLKSSVRLCMFDQYGTIVDMQGGLRDFAAGFLGRKAGPAIPTPSSPGGAAPTSKTP
jgi:hypothetical protein